MTVLPLSHSLLCDQVVPPGILQTFFSSFVTAAAAPFSRNSEETRTSNLSYDRPLIRPSARQDKTRVQNKPVCSILLPFHCPSLLSPTTYFPVFCSPASAFPFYPTGLDLTSPSSALPRPFVFFMYLPPCSSPSLPGGHLPAARFTIP